MGGPQSKEEEEGEKHLLCPAWCVRGRGRRRRRRRRGKRRKGLLTFEVHSRRTEEEGGPMQSHTLDGRGKAAVVHYGTTRKENAFFPGGKEEKKKGEKFVIHVSLYLPTYLELSAIITTIPIIITTIQMANHTTTQQKRTPLCNTFARRRRVIIAEKPWIDDDMPGMRSVRTDWGGKETYTTVLRNTECRQVIKRNLGKKYAFQHFINQVSSVLNVCPTYVSVRSAARGDERPSARGGSDF